MINIEELKNVADNTVVINDVVVGVVTDEVAAKLVELIRGTAPKSSAKSSTTTSNKAAEPKKTTSSTKKSEEPTPNLGYVVAVSGLKYDAFCSLREQLANAKRVEDRAVYKKKREAVGFNGGFVFQTKSAADKAMRKYKDVKWEVIGKM